MIVINVNSQLGNQMFQYALYRKLLYKGNTVKLDLRYFDKKPNHFGLDIFKLQLDVASNKEIAKSRDENRTFVDRFRRKYFGKQSLIFEEITSSTLKYKPEIFNLKKGYIDGYWQSEKYFFDIKSILLSDFKFPKPEDDKNKSLLIKIRNTISVSIHVRRGDYIGGFPLMSVKYYQKAIQYFEKKYNNLFFVVFSNDMEWSRKNIKIKHGEYVDWNTGEKSYVDMYLMTQCKHNIIANSSFSWWGAWLNQNNQKEVIAPFEWLYHQETPDVYCANWIII